MAEQPDIKVTDAGAPAGHLTVSVDGHDTIVAESDARQFIADAVSDNQ